MSRRNNRATIEDFGEDDMPCPCTQCQEWFDLEDGMTNPKKDNEIICAKCATEIQNELDREEEINDLLNDISDAQCTIREARKRLAELDYKSEVDGE